MITLSLLLVAAFLGLLNLAWVVLKACCSLFQAPKPGLPSAGPQERTPEASTPARQPLTRRERLALLEQDISLAARWGGLSDSACRELKAYLRHERQRLAASHTPTPSSASAPGHPDAAEPGARLEEGIDQTADPVPPPAAQPAPSIALEADAPKTPASTFSSPATRSAHPAASQDGQETNPAEAGEENRPLRKPEELRALIAKLQADARAPEPQASPSAARAAAGKQRLQGSVWSPDPARENLQGLPGSGAACHEDTLSSLEELTSSEAPAPSAGEGAGHLLTPEPLTPFREEARSGDPFPSRRAPAAAPETFEGPGPGEPLSGPEGRRSASPAANTAPSAPAPGPRGWRLAERLFTPENVRILQSLGIGIIFISAAAFVKTRMWEGASAWKQLFLLLSGTAACLGTGYALRRWTSLRITGLGFLILGQLAILLDTFAAVFHQGPGQPPPYPGAPSGLWTLSLLLFSASAWWQARKLGEPLFEAFAFFGALAAYGSAAIFCGVAGAAGERWWMMPAAYVPALGLCGWLSSALRRREAASNSADGFGERCQAGGQDEYRLRRWTLEWWLDSAWELGRGLLALLVPAAALCSGRIELASHFGWHAAALGLLGTGLLIPLWRKRRTWEEQAGALLLLALAPLHAWAQGWPYPQWCLAFALPGAGLAVCALGLRSLDRILNTLRTSSGHTPGNSKHSGQRPGTHELSASPIGSDNPCALLQMAAGASALGGAWGLAAWLSWGLDPLQGACCAAAALVAGLIWALAVGAPCGAWLATASLVQVAVLALDAASCPWSWWPSVGLGLALLVQGLWTLTTRWPAQEPAGRHGVRAGEILAWGSVLALAARSSGVLFQGLPATAAEALGWLAFALYLGLTARWRPQTRFLRLTGAIVALAPALALACYAAGLPLGAPAPWLGLLSLCLQLTCRALHRQAGSAAPAAPLSPTRLEGVRALRLGGGLIPVPAILLAILQLQTGSSLAVSVSLALAGLAWGVLATHLRFQEEDQEGPAVVLECASLALLAGAGLAMGAWFEVTGIVWPYLISLLAAGTLLVSLLAESLLRRGPRTEPASSGGANGTPFLTAGTAVSLLLSIGSGLAILGNLPAFDRTGFLQATWVIGLVPLFNAFLPRLRSKRTSPPGWTAPAGTLLAAMQFLCAFILAIGAEFWLPTCRPELRAACALYFAFSLLWSLGWAIFLRPALAPFLATAAGLGLLGCAYGAWPLPPESFGLAAILLGALLQLGSARLRILPEREGQAEACRQAGLLPLSLGMLHLLRGLFHWPSGPTQAWAVFGWAILSWGAWRALRQAVPGRSPRGEVWHGLTALLGACSAVLAGCHAMRWLGLSFTQFGPGLASFSLLLLALREFDTRPGFEGAAGVGEGPLQDCLGALAKRTTAACRRGERASLLLVAWLCGLFSFAAGLGALLGGQWGLVALTLFLEGLGLSTGAVLARRGGLPQAGAPLLLLELGGWGLGLGALAAGLHAAALGWLVIPPTLVLGGAAILVWGMAAESAAGTILPREAAGRVPRAFLESRHLASLALVIWGLLWALGWPTHFSSLALDHTWRTLLGAGLLGVYAGMAEWSVSERARHWGRLASGALSHLLLIPAGYLCLLMAHSTGSSWGALWFLALAPVQLLAAYALEYERQETQAALARGGAWLVSLGALLLAYLGNRGALAEVPCLTWGGLLLLALAGRALDRSGRPDSRKMFSLLGLLSLAGTAFYAFRSLRGDPAFGAADPSVWEWTVQGCCGLLVLIAGGLSRWEPNRSGRSLAAQGGALWLGGATLLASVLLLARGVEAGYLPQPNMARLEALGVLVFLGAGGWWAARRWLACEVGAYLAPLFALAGYGIFVWARHSGAWEWYSLPAAGLLLAWAKIRALELQGMAERAPESGQREVSALLGLATLVMLVPSLVQALPYTPEALSHYYLLLAEGLALVGGAMVARRKIPLLAGSSAVLLGTLLKTAQWAAHREVFLPVLGIGVGFAVLALGCVFESRMNRAIHDTVQRMRAEARMFWVSWE